MAPILALRIRNYFIIRIIFHWSASPLSEVNSASALFSGCAPICVRPHIPRIYITSFFPPLFLRIRASHVTSAASCYELISLLRSNVDYLISLQMNTHRLRRDVDAYASNIRKSTLYSSVFPAANANPRRNCVKSV